MAEGAPPVGGERPDGFEHPDTLENENPAILYQGFNSVVQFLQAYGWFVVIGIALLFYVKSKLDPSIEKWRKKREQQEVYEFDAAVTRTRQGAMESARQRMQQQLDEQASEYAAKQKEKDEEKRKAKIEDWDRHLEGKGYRSKIKPQEGPSTSTGSSTSGKPKKKVYKDDDHNPLSGGGGGSNYCRPRRGNTGGG